ncbi:MAG TPA: BatD family protein [Candidatus Eisenbacteria bacterium]|nr:BatD family protein [Candidatus Eisenbacteria bacterium]
MTGRRARAIVSLALAAATLAGPLAPPAFAAILRRAQALVDRAVVQRGEPVVVSVTVESDGFEAASVEPPAAPGLAIERAGTSQNLTMAAGSVVRTDVALFRVYATVPGKYTIPPFTIRLGKQRSDTAPVSFEVVTTLPPGSGAAGGGPDAGEDDRSTIFARIVVDRRHVIWNEQIVARIQILSRAPLEDMPAWDAPEATGFWAEPLGEPRHDRVTIEGRAFERYERVIAYFPTRPGRLTLGPARARVRAIRRHQPSYDPLGGLFPSPPTEVVELPIEAAPVDIAVDPLPSGAPAGFQGAVGSLSLAVRVDRPRVRAGEPVVVSTAIRGDGNLASATDPVITAHPDAPSYPAGARTELDRSGDRLRGSRRREIAFIPDQPGSLLVMPIAFAWFDPEAGRYRVQSSDTIVVRVDAPKEGSAPSAGTAQTALGTPAPPRPAPAAGGGAAAGAARPGARLDGWPEALPLAAGLLSLAGYAGFGLAASSRRRAAGDPRRRRHALLREAADALAEVAAAPGAARAAERAEAALRDAAGIRFGIDPEGRSRRDLLDRLRAAKVEPAEIETIQSTLRRLEQAAFAPGGDAGVVAAIQEALTVARRWSDECRI